MKHFSLNFTQLSILLAISCAVCAPVAATNSGAGSAIEQFKQAWTAAGRGDHVRFGQLKQDLDDYLLFPYLQYEDYRHRRASVSAGEMLAFLASHQDWAFTTGLRNAWLASLARAGRWSDLVAHVGDTKDTVLRCQRAHGQIILWQTADLLSEAQSLWTIGKSQPKACDPVFAWLIKNSGISPRLAWERVRLAMAAGNPRLTFYLARFIPHNQRRWLENWQRLDRGSYARLERARSWPDNEINRMISAVSIQRLAAKDPAMAAEKFNALDGHFHWGEVRRGELLHAIALKSAVALDAQTTAQMERVPVALRDSQLLGWWVRFLLSRKAWDEVGAVIAQMPDDTRTDDRWRYWLARAESQEGKHAASSLRLETLALEANYFGFLAADELGLPYNICTLHADVDSRDVERLAGLDGFKRALELRKAGLDEWATREWSLTMARLGTTEIKTAAALAQRENWHDRVIFALGNSGDLRIYSWRFPLLWMAEIKHEAAGNQLDPAWVYGTIRSESAMQVSARSTANALGLMQIMPTTGKQVAKKHGLKWSGSAGLKTVAGNLSLGTAYMNDLMQTYQHNPVLVSGAYNAGPRRVQHWLKNRPVGEATIWVETLPFLETRDYIPRVLAFTTLYDWRMGGTVQRISARMPHIESGKIRFDGTAKVVCRGQAEEQN